MWDALKKIDRVLMAIARPFVWLCVILFAIGFIGGLIYGNLTPHPAQTLIWFLLALIVVVLPAVIVWLVRRRHTK